MASSADLDLALATGELSDYLADAGARGGLVVGNLTAWILEVLLLGMGGTLLARLGERRRALADAGRFCYGVGVPLAIASFVAWLALVVQIAPATSDAEIAIGEVVGWFASRADWIATVLVVGVGPAFVSFAGRGDWAPRWLVVWGIAAAAAGLLTTFAMFTSALTTYGVLIVPVGLGWTIAAGTVLLRRARALPARE